MEYLIKLNKLIDTLLSSLMNNFSPNTGIVMPVFNRPDYVKRCFESLKNSTIQNSIIVIVDDNSDKETRDLIEGFNMKDIKIHKIYKTNNRGMYISFVMGFDYICEEYPTVKNMMTLDSDTIHKHDWYEKVMDIYLPHKGNIMVTGYNSKLHKIKSTLNDHHIKESCGGIHMLFNKNMYHDFIRKAFNVKKNGWDWEVVNNCKTKRIPILCTRPSVIQHIGMKGLHAGSNDVALDYH